MKTMHHEHASGGSSSIIAAEATAEVNSRLTSATQCPGRWFWPTAGLRAATLLGLSALAWWPGDFAAAGDGGREGDEPDLGQKT